MSTYENYHQTSQVYDKTRSAGGVKIIRSALAEITTHWPERYDGTLEFLKIWKQGSFVIVFCSFRD